MGNVAAGGLPETRALVVPSGGLGMTMAETLAAVVPPPVLEQAGRQFGERKEPGGQSRLDEIIRQAHKWLDGYKIEAVYRGD